MAMVPMDTETEDDDEEVALLDPAELSELLIEESERLADPCRIGSDDENITPALQRPFFHPEETHAAIRLANPRAADGWADALDQAGIKDEAAFYREAAAAAATNVAVLYQELANAYAEFLDQKERMTGRPSGLTAEERTDEAFEFAQEVVRGLEIDTEIRMAEEPHTAAVVIKFGHLLAIAEPEEKQRLVEAAAGFFQRADKQFEDTGLAPDMGPLASGIVSSATPDECARVFAAWQPMQRLTARSVLAMLMGKSAAESKSLIAFHKDDVTNGCDDPGCSCHQKRKRKRKVGTLVARHGVPDVEEDCTDGYESDPEGAFLEAHGAELEALMDAPFDPETGELEQEYIARAGKAGIATRLMESKTGRLLGMLIGGFLELARKASQSTLFLTATGAFLTTYMQGWGLLVSAVLAITTTLVVRDSVPIIGPILETGVSRLPSLLQRPARLALAAMNIPFKFVRDYPVGASLFAMLAEFLPAVGALVDNFFPGSGYLTALDGAVRYNPAFRLLRGIMDVCNFGAHRPSRQETDADIAEALKSIGKHDPSVKAPSEKERAAADRWAFKLGLGGRFFQSAIITQPALTAEGFKKMWGGQGALMGLAQVTGVFVQTAQVIYAFCAADTTGYTGKDAINIRLMAAYQAVNLMASFQYVLAIVVTQLLPKIFTLQTASGDLNTTAMVLVALSQFLALVVCYRRPRAYAWNAVVWCVQGLVGVAAHTILVSLGLVQRAAMVVQGLLRCLRTGPTANLDFGDQRFVVVPKKKPIEVTQQDKAVKIHASTIVPLAVSAAKMDPSVVDLSGIAHEFFEPLLLDSLEGLRAPPNVNGMTQAELCEWLAHAQNYVMSNIVKAARVGNPTTENKAVLEWTKSRQDPGHKQKRKRN